MLAAYLQQQNQPAPMTVLDGARAGIFAGLIGAFVWLIVTQALDVVLAPLQQRIMTEVLRNDRRPPPEAES